MSRIIKSYCFFRGSGVKQHETTTVREMITNACLITMVAIMLVMTMMMTVLSAAHSSEGFGKMFACQCTFKWASTYTHDRSFLRTQNQAAAGKANVGERHMTSSRNESFWNWNPSETGILRYESFIVSCWIVVKLHWFRWQLHFGFGTVVPFANLFASRHVQRYIGASLNSPPFPCPQST